LIATSDAESSATITGLFARTATSSNIPSGLHDTAVIEMFLDAAVLLHARQASFLNRVIRDIEF
jgi:hypothetical protein